MATNNSINNTSNPITSTSLTIDVGGSGDAAIEFDISATPEWIMGCDDSASDSFKISQGSAIGTNDALVMTQAGERTLPLQPSFLATTSATQTNATGNGTTATVTFGSEIIDRNSDYDGTNTFTAPVTGKYIFRCTVGASDGTSSSTLGTVQFTTSNRNLIFFECNYGNYYNTSGVGVKSGSVFTDMDAADTCTVQITITGEGSDRVDLGATAANNYFGGQLIC